MNQKKSFFQKIFSSDDTFQKELKENISQSIEEEKICEQFLSLIIQCVDSFKVDQLPSKGYFYLYILVFEYIKKLKKFNEIYNLLELSEHHPRYEDVLKKHLVEKFSSNSWFTKKFYRTFQKECDYFSEQFFYFKEQSMKGISVPIPHFYIKLYDIDTSTTDYEGKDKFLESYSKFNNEYSKLLSFISKETTKYCNNIKKMNVITKDVYTTLYKKSTREFDLNQK